MRISRAGMSPLFSANLAFLNSILLLVLTVGEIHCLPVKE